ncbi:MAG: hypothetical protein KGJ24_12215 [Burkholderiales bacterium]|nr:hypothetical protein [Burkholderiales bacterium]
MTHPTPAFRRFRRAGASAACTLALTAGPALPALAQVAAPSAAPSAAGPAAPYLNGGIGLDEQQAMKQAARDWPLRMTFSEHRNDVFVAGVDLRVTDGQGRSRLHLDAAGPITYVRLPPGRYRVSARHHGQTETREVTIGAPAGVDLAFHWQGPKP